VTLKATFYPQDAPENPVVRDVSVGPKEVRMFSGAVASLFGMKNTSGAVHFTSTAMSSIVATGRTYDRKPEGTSGQFIPAVTMNDAIGTSSRPLQILQVEESTRMRTNIGLAEVSGQPVTVRVAAILPGKATAPVLTYDLKAFEFKQIPALKLMNLTGAYNVRVTVEVLSGAGKVTAYASVVDNESQDATYVPAQ
jgi:hypothetical protein